MKKILLVGLMAAVGLMLSGSVLAAGKKATKAPVKISYAKGARLERDRRRADDLILIQKALEMYFVSAKHYPSGKNVNLGAIGASCLNSAGWQKRGCKDAFLNTISRDPLGGYYVYNKTAAGYGITVKQFELAAANKIQPVIFTQAAIQNLDQAVIYDKEVKILVVPTTTKADIYKEYNEKVLSGLNGLELALKKFKYEKKEFPDGEWLILSTDKYSCLGKDGFEIGNCASAYWAIDSAMPKGAYYVYTKAGEGYVVSYLTRNDTGRGQVKYNVPQGMITEAQLPPIFVDRAGIKTRDALRLSYLKQLQTVLAIHFTERNTYPSGAGATLGMGDFACLNIYGWGRKGCFAPYLATAPRDPKVDYKFIYSFQGGPVPSYIIEAELEGELEGLKGPIKLTPWGVVNR